MPYCVRKAEVLLTGGTAFAPTGRDLSVRAYTQGIALG